MPEAKEDDETDNNNTLKQKFQFIITRLIFKEN
jgi:hypothetical protein